MPETLSTPPAVEGDDDRSSTGPTLATVVDELRAQGARMRRTQQGFALFAVMALLLAGVNLLVIAAKLNGNSTTTVPRTVTSAATAGTGAAAATGAAGRSCKWRIRFLQTAISVRAYGEYLVRIWRIRWT